jgi:tight adherence protein B
VSLTPFQNLSLNVDPNVLKYGGAALGIFASSLWAWRMVSHTDTLPYRIWRSYQRYLDSKLRELFLQVKPETIATTQCLLLVVLGAASPVLGATTAIACIAAVAFGPMLYLARYKKKRLRALEGQIEPFLLALTNALRTTPSIGSALEQVHTVMANPMREELGLVLKELRVGSTLDQALLAMAARTHLDDLDAALSSILIGRQVGGNVTEILETTGGTLREMSRLAAVLKSKTSSGRVQFIVLAAAPIVVVVAFETINPGYFNPLLTSLVGGVVLMVAAGLWLVAVGLARQVMSRAA